MEVAVMERVRTSDLAAHVDERVLLRGWLQKQRRLARVSFLVVRDASGIAQVVVIDPAQREEMASFLPETVLEVEGTVVANEKSPGGVEVHSPSVRPISCPTEPPPIQLQRPVLLEQLPTILDSAPIALRHPRQRATFQIAAGSLFGFRSALEGMGFIEIQTPKIVASATESGANVFRIDYFGRPAFLAQSPQFYKQIMVGVFERVFEVGPVFRAEPHDTTRHIAEYVSLDAELGFIEDHRTVMAALRDAVAGMLGGIRKRAAAAVELLDLSLPEVPSEIPVVHFSDAQLMIEDATGEKVAGEPDLTPAHERWLGDWAAADHGSQFLFVVGYPMVKRPFYTCPDPDRPGFSNSFDLLFRGVELVTGGQRLHRYEDYLAALAARGEGSGPYESYLQAFRHGMPPHGGFAIGLERWVAQLTAASNIREATLFPRDLNRLTP
jgi:nondiscriminating aspartyl-tRNA synthetase